MPSALERLRAKLERSETCEGCGAPFTCGALSGSCWCMQQELSDAARARLKESFQRCLCPECLRSAADKQ